MIKTRGQICLTVTSMELQKILTPFEGKTSTNLVRLSLLHIRPRVQRGRDFFKDNFVYLNFIGSSYKTNLQPGGPQSQINIKCFKNCAKDNLNLARKIINGNLICKDDKNVISG